MFVISNICVQATGIGSGDAAGESDSPSDSQTTRGQSYQARYSLTVAPSILQWQEDRVACETQIIEFKALLRTNALLQSSRPDAVASQFHLRLFLKHIFFWLCKLKKTNSSLQLRLDIQYWRKWHKHFLTLCLAIGNWGSQILQTVLSWTKAMATSIASGNSSPPWTIPLRWVLRNIYFEEICKLRRFVQSQ